MAAFTVSAASLRLKDHAASNTIARTVTLTATETIVPGDPINSSGGIVDITNAAKLDIVGVAINYASNGTKVVVATAGLLEFSNTVSVGVSLYCDEGGDWQYAGDMQTDDYSVQIGVTLSTTSLLLRPYNVGVQIP